MGNFTLVWYIFIYLPLNVTILVVNFLYKKCFFNIAKGTTNMVKFKGKYIIIDHTLVKLTMHGYF